MFIPDMVDTFVAEIHAAIAVQKGAAMPPCTVVSDPGPKGDGWRRFLSGLFYARLYSRILHEIKKPDCSCDSSGSPAVSHTVRPVTFRPPVTRGVALSEHVVLYQRVCL
jgi:hypothetical protein